MVNKLEIIEGIMECKTSINWNRNGAAISKDKSWKDSSIR